MDLEVIRRILVQAKTTGVEQTTAQLKGLSAGYEGVTVASQKTETATESAARKFQRLEGFLDPAARAARQLAKDISTLDQAFAQGGVSAERHAQLLNAATESAVRMSGGAAKATGAMEGLRQATSGVSKQLVAMSANIGPVGVFLSAIPGWGAFAAVGLGLATAALRTMADASHAVGQKAIEIKKFADTTGLSVTQVQALRIEGAKFSLSSEDIEHALRTMSVRWEELRVGEGEALKVLQRYKPGLVDAAAGMEGAEDRLNLLREAFDGLTVSQQNALSKGFFGKAGIEQAQLFKQLDINAITKLYVEAGRGLNEEQVKFISKLEIENQSLRRIAGESFAKLFAPDVLEVENSFLRGLIEINHQIKELIKNREVAGQQKSWLGEFGKLAAQTLLPVPSAIVSGVSAFDPVAKAKAQADEMKVLLDRQVELNDAMASYQRIADEAGKWPIDLVFQMEKAVAELDKVNARIEIMRDKGDDIQSGAGIQSLAKDAGIKDIGKKMPGFEIAQEQKRIALLGEAATAAEKQALSLKILKTAYDDGALSAKDYKRAVEAVNTTAAALTATHAAAIQTLEARTAAEREAAAAATVQAGGGGDVKLRAQQAVTMEIAKQAQAHRDAMNAMAGQLQIAQAVTGAQKMAAQEAATYNDLIRQGRTAQQALAEATKQTEIAQAAANSAVKEQIYGIEKETELINTRSQYEKESVQIRQAYNDAIRSGADAQTASALAAAVARKQEAEASAQSNERAKQIQVTEANRATAISQCNQAIDAQNDRLAESARLTQEIADAAADAARWALEFRVNPGGGADQQGMQGGKTGTVISPIGQAMLQEKARQEALGKQVVEGSPGSAKKGESEIGWSGPYGSGGAFIFKDTVESLFYKLMGLKTGEEVDTYKKGEMEKQAQSQYAQEAVKQFEMRRVEAQIGGDKGAEISAVQEELAYYKGQPRTLENLNQIKSLTDTLKQLTDATKDNTQSQNALSGLYSRQFGQGFYDGGAAVGELIYGLDNNTSGAIDDMQKAANDNAKTQNDLLKDLSQNQISSFSYMGGGIVSATNGVQSELRTGFAEVVMAVKTPAGTTPSSPSGTSPPPTTPPHILGFARGGSFTTSGYGGDDSNVVAFRVSPQRERVTITPVAGGRDGGGNVNHFYNDISINIPQNTDEFRSSAMQVAGEIFNQLAFAGGRK